MPNILAKKIGPLPLGIWLGVVGGGLAVAYVIRKRRAEEQAAAPPIEQDAGNFPTLSTDPATLPYGVGPGQFYEGSPGGSPFPPQRIEIVVSNPTTQTTTQRTTTPTTLRDLVSRIRTPTGSLTPHARIVLPFRGIGGALLPSTAVDPRRFSIG